MSKFKLKIGDKVLYLGKTNSSFVKNDTYKILKIDDINDYPFKNMKFFKNTKIDDKLKPKVLTIKDRKNITFFLIYTDEGFYSANDNLECGYELNFETFTINRKLRKEKLNKLNNY